MAETLALPVPGNAGSVSTNKITDGSMQLSFDLSSLTSDRTVTVPDLDVIFPAKVGTSIGVGRQEYKLGDDCLMLGPNATADSTSAVGRIAFGNATNTVNNSIRLPTSVTSIKTAGIATATTSYTLFYNTSTGQITYGSPSNLCLGTGTETAPTTNVATDTNSGIFQPVANALSVTANGVEAMRFFNQQFLNAFNGSASFPAYSFENDLDCGLYRVGANTLGIATDGIARIQLDTAFLACLDGTVSAPVFSFQSDLTYGFYRVGTNSFSMSGSGVQTVNISDSLYVNQFSAIPGFSLVTNASDSNFPSYSLGLAQVGIHSYGAAIEAAKISASSGSLSNAFHSITYAHESVVSATKSEAVSANSYAKSTAIDADGCYYVVGAPTSSASVGCAYVYYNYSSSSTTLSGTGATGASQQGQSVAISGDGTTIAVGGPADNTNRGAVWIYVNSGGSWSQQGAKITSNVVSSQFGTSVALSYDGNIMAIGAPGEATSEGKIYIYTRSGTTWTQVGAITAPADADDIYGSTAIGLGSRMAISSDGKTLAATALGARGTRGAVAIFRGLSGISYTSMAYYTSEAIGAGAAMGTGLTMSADGRIVAMGAPNHSSNAGLVCVFINCDITPLLVQSFSNFTANDYFGQYLSFTSDASLLLIGSSFTSTTIGTRKTYMYYRTYGNLYTLYKSISPALSNYDRYGFGTAISGNGALVIIGFEPNAATNTYGQLEVYNYPEASRICMNATFYAPAGSAAAPSYSFGREPGTGLFMPMVDTIGASINGTHVLNFTTYGLIPATDNVVSLGTNSKKFSNVYCTNSTINTSDARLKIWTECDRGMDFIKEVKTYKYKINNQDSLGLIAQDFINEFDSTEAILERGEYYGLRYSEFIPIIVKAIQEYCNKN